MCSVLLAPLFSLYILASSAPHILPSLGPPLQVLLRGAHGRRLQTHTYILSIPATPCPCYQRHAVACIWRLVLLVMYDLCGGCTAFPHRLSASIAAIYVPELSPFHWLTAEVTDSPPACRSVCADGRCGDLIQSEPLTHVPPHAATSGDSIVLLCTTSLSLPSTRGTLGSSVSCVAGSFYVRGGCLPH